MEISIIVPVYNSEKYIKRCIDSIIKQTYQNFELIIINDGSTDNSLKIINDNYSKYKNIKIINQTNSGVSKSRNKGIEIAKGKYICFVDSDDYIDSNLIYNLLNQNNDYDWILSGIYDYNENKLIKQIKYKDNSLNLNDINDFIIFHSQPLLTSPVAKLYKRDIIIKKQLKFNVDLSFGEDRDFNYRYAQHIDKIKLISSIGYYYEQNNPFSLSKQLYSYKLKNDCLYWNLLKDSFYKRGYINKECEKIIANELFNIVNDAIKLATKTYTNESLREYLKNNTTYIDRGYLKRNFNIIDAPIWLKIIIIYFPYNIIGLFHSKLL